MQNINRRKAISSILKSSIGSSAIVGSMASISTGCQPTNGKEEMNRDVKPMLMKVGCQHGGTGKQNLEFLARHGVFNMDGGAPKTLKGVGWDLDDAIVKKGLYVVFNSMTHKV